MPRPVALITGASGGLGEQFARLVAADGYDLVIVARKKEVLEVLAEELRTAHGINAFVLACDLGSPDAVGEVEAFLKKEGITVSMLINNAGIGIHGDVVENAPEELRGMLTLNVVTLTALTRAVLPAMIAAKHGRILNVASTAAFSPGPGMTAYFASKAYVLSFSEGLATELKGKGITVTCLCPGPTATGFAAQAKLGGTPLFSSHVMQPAAVARAGYRACLQGRRCIVPGLRNKILTFGPRLVPRAFSAAIARQVIG